MTHHERRLRRAAGALIGSTEYESLRDVALELSGYVCGLQQSRRYLRTPDDRMTVERALRHARRLEGHAYRLDHARDRGLRRAS